jgi:aminoglycoside phosphotransferase (APT) family kinase protein
MVEKALGVSIRWTRAYSGGSSSAIHGIGVKGDHGTETVVLRRYVIEELNVEEPDLAAREARVLRLLERCDTPTPGLLAVDPTGRDAGVPSVLMTRVSGRLDWTPADLDGWLHRLAAALPPIHAVSIGPGDGVQDFVPYKPSSWEPPTWLKRKRLWYRALEVFHGPRLDADRVFIHRDYHPGNILWRRARVSGVVDWHAASIGPRAADVWHCRGNLLSHFGLQVADRFIDVWESITGETYHPWAETVMLIDAISWPHHDSAQEQNDLETLLARRLAELGG